MYENQEYVFPVRTLNPSWRAPRFSLFEKIFEHFNISQREMVKLYNNVQETLEKSWKPKDPIYHNYLTQEPISFKTRDGTEYILSKGVSGIDFNSRSVLRFIRKVPFQIKSKPIHLSDIVSSEHLATIIPDTNTNIDKKMFEEFYGNIDENENFYSNFDVISEITIPSRSKVFKLKNKFNAIGTIIKPSATPDVIYKQYDTEKEVLAEETSLRIGSWALNEKIPSESDMYYYLRDQAKNSHLVSVQEDVTNVANYKYDLALKSETKKGINQYMNYWLKTLAEVHILGSKYVSSKYGDDFIQEQAMKASYLVSDNIYKNIQKLEKTKSNLIKNGSSEESITKVNQVLKDKMRMLELDQIVRADGEDDWIHADIKSNNMVGNYLVDWANSGWGNGLYDFIRLLKSTDMRKYDLSVQEEKRYLKMYLSEKERLKQNFFPEENVVKVTDEYVDKKYIVYSALKELYNPLFRVWRESHDSNNKTFATIDLEEKFSTQNELTSEHK